MASFALACHGVSNGVFPLVWRSQTAVAPLAGNVGTQQTPAATLLGSPPKYFQSYPGTPMRFTTGGDLGSHHHNQNHEPRPVAS